ncbi:YfiR family protein [Xanthocytophaga agilis]|uniref:YfiR family protein n=1 Tax=Xanthocytophaga agilis TaxID=3048010 RepID=A0AAE3UGN2_9BACT|nr:YfiR family protein [Xanthocytophaga agilis]MDJ1505138.1 YfiR family protein [Xanthocytophaga agilis]
MKQYYSLIYIVVFSLVLPVLQASAQQVDSKLTCIFIYNFTKYIKWPPNTESGDFVIGVLGDSPVEAELQKLTSKLKVNGVRNIAVKKFSSDANASTLQTCHILYISKKESKTLKELSNTLSSSSTLLVSEGMGMANKGSTISIYIDEETDQIKLELNKKMLESHKLKASSELLALAVVI